MIAQFVKEKHFHFHQEMKDKICRSISLHGGNFLSTLSSQSVERVFISTVGSDPLSIKLFFFAELTIKLFIWISPLPRCCSSHQVNKKMIFPCCAHHVDMESRVLMCSKFVSNSIFRFMPLPNDRCDRVPFGGFSSHHRLSSYYYFVSLMSIYWSPCFYFFVVG